MDVSIEIKNIGKIEQANIALNGLTIIAGENNTGKSTIGKTVFSIFQGLKNWPLFYYNYCIESIYLSLKKSSETLESFCMEKTKAIRRRTNRVNRLVEEVSREKDFIICIEDYQYAELLEDKEATHTRLAQLLLEFCKRYILIFQNDVQTIMLENKDFLDKWIDDAARSLEASVEMDENVLQGRFIRKSFLDCFNKQYLREGQDTATIKIKFGSQLYQISLDQERCNILPPIRFGKEIYFIESPKLFDEISRLKDGMDAKKELREIMRPNSILNISKTAQQTFESYESMEYMEEIPEELEDILSMLREEMGGYARLYAKEGVIFKDDDLKKPVKAQNMSTGVKAMAFLEYALRIGAIQKGDILILDEPEINLHPEWQESYARALVLLHKKYALTILITSHSPYFIRAIECLADKYDVMNDLNVYLVDKNDHGEQRIENVMESEYGMTELYDILSAPLDALQDEIDEKYN